MAADVMDVLPFPNRQQPRSPGSRSESIAGLDAVRAGAAFGVVLLHAGVAYLRHPMPGLAWPTRDHSSAWVDFSFWSIELFIMPLFLVLAGFFAWQSLQRVSTGKFIRRRFRRLVKPFCFAAVVILPLDLYCWVLGWVADGIVAPVKLKSLKFGAEIDRDLWGLSHLWFLQYLLTYLLLLGTTKALLERRHRRRETPNSRRESLNSRRETPNTRRSFGLGSWVVQTCCGTLRRTILGVLVVGTVVLVMRPNVVWGFQHAFLPVASKWVYSGLFFLLGVALAKYDPQLKQIAARSYRLLGPAVALAVPTVWLGQWHLHQMQEATSPSHAAALNVSIADVMLAMMTCASGIAITLGIIGFAVARVQRVPRPVSYLAAASFWVYLVHHPLIGLVHQDLKWWFPMSEGLLISGPNVVGAIKWIAAFLITSVVCVLSYEACVRKTWLGRWLGFQWTPPVAAASTHEHTDDASNRKPTQQVWSRAA